MPGLINESATRNAALDYDYKPINLGLKRAAFSKLQVTKPVDSVPLGEERKSSTCLIALFHRNGFYPNRQDIIYFRSLLLGNSLGPCLCLLLMLANTVTGN